MATTKKLNVKKALQNAINILGLKPMAKGLDLSYQSIRLWQSVNRMPDTEFSCRTSHSVKIEKLTKGQVTVTDLLGYIPVCQVKK